MNENRNDKAFENCNDKRNEKGNEKSNGDSRILSCEIIGDLLPLYVDDIASDDSRKAVDEHVESCPGCRKKLRDMTSSLGDATAIATEEQVDVDAFKKCAAGTEKQLQGASLLQ